VNPPADPWRTYTVVPVALAFVKEPNESEGADGAVVSFTVMLGEDARFVSAPPASDFSCAVQVCAPAVTGAVAPGPPDAVLPYVIVIVAAPASVTLETVIVWPEAETVPVPAVV
jgi:hypothetical protein